MNGFNFNHAPKPEQDAGQKIIHSGAFWPEINLDHLRQEMRIDNAITSARLYHAAVATVANVNQQLESLREKAEAVGQTTLAQTNTKQQINGESLPVIRYRRAVYTYTKALLLEAYADHDAAGKTASRADAKQEQAVDNRREGHHAVADLLGRQRVDCELV